MTVFAYLCPTHFFLFAKLCWIIHKTPQTPFWMGEIKKWVSCAFPSSLLTGVVEVLSGWVVTLVIDYYFCVWCVVGTFFWRTTLTGKADVTTLWVEWFIFLRNVYHQHGAQHSPSLWRPVHFKHWISPSSAVQWSTLSQRSAHHSYVLEKSFGQRQKQPKRIFFKMDWMRAESGHPPAGKKVRVNVFWVHGSDPYLKICREAAQGIFTFVSLISLWRVRSESAGPAAALPVTPNTSLFALRPGQQKTTLLMSISVWPHHFGFNWSRALHSSTVGRNAQG